MRTLVLLRSTRTCRSEPETTQIDDFQVKEEFLPWNTSIFSTSWLPPSEIELFKLLRLSIRLWNHESQQLAWLARLSLTLSMVLTCWWSLNHVATANYHCSRRSLLSERHSCTRERWKNYSQCRDYRSKHRVETVPMTCRCTRHSDRAQECWIDVVIPLAHRRQSVDAVDQWPNLRHDRRNRLGDSPRSSSPPDRSMIDSS